MTGGRVRRAERGRESGRLAEAREPLTDRQLELMLTVFLRKERAFQSAVDRLRDEHFAPQHAIYAVVWASAKRLYEEYGQLPAEDVLATEVETALNADPTFADTPDQTWEDLDQFIRRAYWINSELLSDQVAQSYLKRYREDHLMRTLRERNNQSGYTPTDIYSLLESYVSAADEIRTFDSVAADMPFPEGWDISESRVNTRMTNLGFLDAMLDGGCAPKEVVGVIGPTGSCKTTLMLHASTEIARSVRSEWRTGKAQKLGFVYTFFYEGSLNEMRMRALCCAAMVPRKTLQKGDMAALSRSDCLKPYEASMYDNGDDRLVKPQGESHPGVIRLGEYERFQLAVRQLNDNWRCIDMTGSDPKAPGRGAGSISEIATIIEADQRNIAAAGRVEPYVAGVFIDYAGAAIERYIDFSGERYDGSLRHLLQRFPYHAKQKLAVRYDTTVWILHQLAGKANAVTHCRPPKGTEASECRSFRENCDFMLVLGNPDRTNRCMIRQDKHRRSEQLEDMVLQIEGDFGRVVSASQQYALDRYSGQIVSIDEARRTVRDMGDLARQSTNEYPEGLPSVANSGGDLYGPSTTDPAYSDNL